MSDYSGLKRLAEAALNDKGDYVALNDYGMAVPPAVVLGLIEEYERVCALNHSQFGDAIRRNAECGQFKAENERLRSGMKGDYDLDAWLDWAREAEALRADAARYRWVEPVFAGLFGIESLDAHIDAAKGDGEQS